MQRDLVDNALKAAFRAVVGFDPANDGARADAFYDDVPNRFAMRCHPIALNPMPKTIVDATDHMRPEKAPECKHNTCKPLLILAVGQSVRFRHCRKHSHCAGAVHHVLREKEQDKTND